MKGRIFNYDGPFFGFLNTFANIIILSVVTLVCCIPVITFGPAVRALYVVSLKMVRNEESYVVKDFFKSFKSNFLQNVILGLLVLLALGFFGGGLYSMIMIGSAFHIIIKIGFGMGALIVIATILWIFPMQSRFKNPIKQTVKLSFWLAVTKFPKTILMLIIWLFIPACVVFISGNFVPLVFLAELGTAAYFCAEVYDDLFRELEDKINGNEE
ncbi:MAG: DUF624 domain-containing protein [Lachnospiraceae bacterium]|nr:DUF624 domain-containing protein [Lachnospiraceae bacterium]